jgi:prepilin-type N-terminal cleavage/methylation domain-containing protein
MPARPEIDASRGSAAGFTLLEAIVSLAVVGIALVPMISFLAEATRQVSAAAEANARADAQQAAMGFLEVLNPLRTPDGQTALSEHLALRWESTALVDTSGAVPLGGRLGQFRIGFFTVEMTVIKDQADWFTFEARKIGYIPAAAPIMPGFPEPQQ